MINKIKYGIIGVGAMGQEHIQNINLIDNAEVVAICDTNQDSTKRARSLIKDDSKVYDNILFQDFCQIPLLDLKSLLPKYGRKI